MSLVDDWALEDDEEFPYTVDANGFPVTAADWELDCSDGNAVALCSQGRVFTVPTRCKKLRECLACRDWWWTRQRDYILDALERDKIDTLWVAERVTNRELDAARDIRRKLNIEVDWAWANTPDGRTYIATADLTQTRGRRFQQGRMKAMQVDAGLIVLGDAYLRADTSRRQPCRRWRIPVRSFLLGFGNKSYVDRVMNIAFGGGNTWHLQQDRQLTPTEIVTRFRAAWDTLRSN